MHVTKDGVHTEGDEGTRDSHKHSSGHTSALRARDGLEKSHANAVCYAGAMGGGSTASFTCHRIFFMTRTSVIAAMIRGVPCIVLRRAASGEKVRLFDLI